MIRTKPDTFDFICAILLGILIVALEVGCIGLLLLTIVLWNPILGLFTLLLCISAQIVVGTIGYEFIWKPLKEWVWWQRNY